MASAARMAEWAAAYLAENPEVVITLCAPTLHGGKREFLDFVYNELAYTVFPADVRSRRNSDSQLPLRENDDASTFHTNFPADIRSRQQEMHQGCDCQLPPPLEDDDVDADMPALLDE